MLKAGTEAATASTIFFKRKTIIFGCILGSSLSGRKIPDELVI